MVAKSHGVKFIGDEVSDFAEGELLLMRWRMPALLHQTF